MTNTAQDLRTGEFGAVLSRLIKPSPGPHRVITCYVPLPPDARQRRQYVKRFRERLRAAAYRAHATLSSPTVRQLEDDFTRIEEYLRSPSRLPVAGGVSIFACKARALFEVLPMPRVLRPRIVVDRSASVRELVELDAEFTPDPSPLRGEGNGKQTQASEHPRGTLALVGLYGLLFAAGWLAFYIYFYLARGPITP